MKPEIIIYMVVRNVSQKLKLFTEVLHQARKISPHFYIVNHGSSDDTIDIINDFSDKNELNLELVNESFTGTMDDMKGKHYQVLKNKYGNEKKFIFILDWDEVLDDWLIEEIKMLDFSHDVYMINRHTYLISKSIDQNSYLPLLFEINSVEIAPFEKFHKLYNILSDNTKKLDWVLHHYSYENIQELLNKNIFYGKNEAIDLYEKNKNISNTLIFFKFIMEWSTYFVYTLFYHFNFLNLEWWLYSLNWYVYKYYKYLFYLELKEKNAR